MNEEMGYYICNGIKFNSKIKACVYGSQNKKLVDWVFNDHIFNTYPWEIEPESTLDQLYDRRARQIREKYDYVLLAFSGGSDSNNILESFIRQGLHIDEVVHNVMGDHNNFIRLDKSLQSSWNEASEYHFQTLPRLDYIKKVSPNTRISVIDLSGFVFQFLNDAGDESWLDHTRERLNVTGVLRHNFLHFKEIRKRFDKDKKIALILGVEKPRTYIKDGIFNLLFTDKALNIATVEEFIQDYSNSTVEYFYSHPDCAELICKQAHVIKKWLELNPQWIPQWTPNSLDDLFKKHRLIHERLYRTMIYTTWDNNWWQADKSTLDWYSEIDDWFTKGHQNSKEFAIWKAGIEYIKKNASDYIIQKNGQDYGLKGYLKNYRIGEINPIYVKR
jgi:hypothetical protein